MNTTVAGRPLPGMAADFAGARIETRAESIPWFAWTSVLASFCIAIGLYLVPVGFATAQSRLLAAVLALLAFNFVAVLAPTNVMIYDTAQFYNTALGILAGAGAAALGLVPSGAHTPW